MRQLLLVMLVAGVWQPTAGSQQPAAPAKPALLVIVVADQMRADHLVTFRDRWKSGLRVLFDEGAYFPQAEFPYLNTVTCAGHTTIGTGAYPRTHGGVLNGWWERDLRRYRNCMDDPTSPYVSYGKPASSGSSGMRILVPNSFLTAEPVEKDLNQTWALHDRERTYRFPDVGVGERPTAGWTALFPHPLTGRAGTDGQFYERWQKSPFSDAYLARMATSLVDSMRLGQRDGTDYLAVAFAALDMMGHDFGPRSREVEDLLMQLDASLGALVQRLDDRIGRDRYVLALTGDHGAAPIPDVAMPGVARVLRADRLSRASEDQATRAAAFGYYPGRSGDLIVVPKPYWILELRADPDATEHGTMYSYDRRVPLFLLGNGIRRGHVAARVSPADVAPTLAFLAGVPLPSAEGRVLREALK